jgi:hypothetical protein
MASGHDDPPVPGDVPEGRPEALDRLEALVGEWETEATFEAGFFGPGTPAISGGGRTTFEWFEGRFFLIQRAAGEDASVPRGVMVIGLAEDGDTFEQHYYDSRGVSRVYLMTLDGGTWTLWRDAPGFNQRYVGSFSEDGTRITGAWEKSADGVAWEHDFDLSYRKL